MLNFTLIYVFLANIDQKLHQLMTLFLQTAILSISTHCTEKMSFLRSWDQTGSEAHFLFEKLFRKCDLMWFGVDLTLLCHWLSWIQITKWLLFLHSTCKSDYKSCAACPKKFFFGELSWPDLTLTRNWDGTYAHRMSSLAIWGYFGLVSSKNHLYCRP